MPIRVIADTNFLMLPAQRRIDIVEGMEQLLNRKVEIVVPQPVLDELLRLKRSGRPVVSRHASVALEVVERSAIDETRMLTGESVDDLIVRLACEKKYPVATNDVELRRRLRNINVAVIYLRQLSHLVVEGVVE